MGKILVKIKKVLNGQFIKNISIYTISEIINKAIPFLLLPILTRYLSPHDYGILSMFTVLMGITRSIIGFSAHGAVMRKYFDKKNTDFYSFIYNVFLLLGISWVILSIIYILFNRIINSYLLLPTVYIEIAVLIAMFEFIIMITLIVFQVKKLSIQFSMLQNFNSITQISFVLFFIIVLGFKWEGRIIGQAVSGLIVAFISLYILINKQWIKKKFNYKYIKYTLFFGLPLVPHELGKYVIGITDKLFITNFVGLNSTGIYTVGYQISMAIDVIIMAFNRAWLPFLFERLNRKNIELNLLLVKITYLSFVILLLLAVFLFFSTKIIMPYLVGKHFQQAINYVLVVSLGFSFRGMTTLLNNFLYYTEKTFLITKVTVPVAVFNILITYFLISNFGTRGATYGIFITFFLQFLLTFYIVMKNTDLPWALKKDVY